MGVDISSYRCRIGTFQHGDGLDVVFFCIQWKFATCMFIVTTLLYTTMLANLSFVCLNITRRWIYMVIKLMLKTPVELGPYKPLGSVMSGKSESNKCKHKGSLEFINMLLLLSGIESNPGPMTGPPHSTYKENVEMEEMNSLDNYVGRKLVCDPCKLQHVTQKTTVFCQHCEEKFCHDCVQVHNVHEGNACHSIESLEHPCDICLALKKSPTAVFRCLDCSEINKLCLSCAKQHKSMKSTMKHRISPGMILSRRSDTLSDDENMAGPLFDDACVQTEEVGSDTRKMEKPGRPNAIVLGNGHVNLKWTETKALGEHDFYEIKFKEQGAKLWQSFMKTTHLPNMLITDLKFKTSYVFKIRQINAETGEDGMLSDESDNVTTVESSALKLQRCSTQISFNSPAIFKLPLEEVHTDNDLKLRSFRLGDPRKDYQGKTVLIVGATNSGKIGLINTMTNYILGVNWDDQFRFQLVGKDQCQVPSKAKWLTGYTIHQNIASRLDYALTIIHAPDFDLTTDLQKGSTLVQQIRSFFTHSVVQGVSKIDALCFAINAQDTQLSTSQIYVFGEILSMFGKDIKGNSCTLITLEDGQDQSVLTGLHSLKDNPLPYNTYFPFNISALYSDQSYSLSNIFWNMEIQNCKLFFDTLSSLKTKIVKIQSVEKQNEKHIMKLRVVLSKINVLEKEQNVVNKSQATEEKEVERTFKETHPVKKDISKKGIYTTTCLICAYPCHGNCTYKNDSDRAECMAMNKNNGRCKRCPQKCHWKQHSNVPYIIEWVTTTTKTTCKEIQQQYQKNRNVQLTHEQLVDTIHQNIENSEIAFLDICLYFTMYNNTLKEKQGQPNPMSTLEHMDLMIKSENMTKHNGFLERIKVLKNCKIRAMTDTHVHVFQERLSESRDSTPKEIQDYVMGRAFIANELLHTD